MNLKTNIFLGHKCINMFSLIFVLVLFAVGGVSSTYCYVYTDQNNELISNINLHSSTDLESRNGAIVNIDVSSDGYIAVALDNKSILVYEENGTFLKQFSFDSYGSYCVRWHADNIELILAREDAVVEFTLDCELVGVKYIDSSQIIRELENRTKLTMNNETYELKNKGFTGYSTLVRINESGVESTLYSSYVASIIKSIIMVTFFVLGFTVVPYVILRKQIKSFREKRKCNIRET